MLVKFICTLLAKVGHKLDGDKTTQALILEREFYATEINTYIMKRLSTIQDILSKPNDINDLVMLESVRKFSLDYDYKRKPLADGTTVPHTDMKEFARYHGSCNHIRAKLHKRATPELVEYYQLRSKQNVRQRGGNKQDCIKHFIRALIQNVHPFDKSGLTYREIANKLFPHGVTENDLKNANRKPFVSNVVFNNGTNRSLIRAMLKSLNVATTDNYAKYIDLLVHQGISNSATIFK